MQANSPVSEPDAIMDEHNATPNTPILGLTHTQADNSRSVSLKNLVGENIPMNKSEVGLPRQFFTSA